MQQMQLCVRDRVSCCVHLCALVLAFAPLSLRAQSLPPWERPAQKAGAATLPATPTTSQSAAAAKTLPAPIAATPVGNNTPAHRAEVSYAGGLIDVRANNSSLHQILRAISRQTGMTITGGVADDRVFGNYGPAAPSSVLATLIDGTGTNMLLREGDATHPMELVLTPRTGGATAGNDTIGTDADDSAEQPTQQAQPARQPALQRTSTSPAANRGLSTSSAPLNRAQNRMNTPASIPQPANDVNGSPLNTSPTAATFPTTNSVPIDSVPTPSTTPSTSGIVDAPNPPSAVNGNGNSSNAVPTPEQVYQQLLQMQQKQQQTTPGTTAPQ